MHPKSLNPAERAKALIGLKDALGPRSTPHNPDEAYHLGISYGIGILDMDQLAEALALRQVLIAMEDAADADVATLCLPDLLDAEVNADVALVATLLIGAYPEDAAGRHWSTRGEHDSVGVELRFEDQIWTGAGFESV